ncbi:LysR family transcriptional regulator [Montanilutibacter psychrotolerans]|uniref:LysR family transcriptional regulator n=1 Tax=Montanilutibacter psychrotolerans TaxID=1327343 RepID=A0A3M8SZQ0_9GAMM|nr:LysR family transcriptional regulator [Lysobacter psychrotolerans]RNF84916.1 LysR family transcriptional regulator [Lysobacter psychrotolerans]
MARQFDALMLGSIELFCLSAELESFTLAATRAGLTPAAVSRSVSRLESRLGVRLFVRSTRKVRLTDAGRAYHAQCRPALSQLAEAERELTGQQLRPAGIVRISVSTPLGHCRLLPRLAAFRALYPDVQVDVHLSNRNIDFIAEGFDLAIRGRTPPDSGLVARKLEDAALVVVATPEYLARRGTPRTLADLDRHDCIQFVLPSSGQRVPWLFRDVDRDVELATEGGACCSGDLLATVTLARHGAGVLQTYRFIVEDDLRDGRLVEVLSPYGGRSRPFSLIYPGSRHMPLRVRVLVDFLMAQWGAG